MDATAIAWSGAAFTAGLLGGVHCASMCGGIAGAIEVSNREVRVAVHRSRRAFILATLKRTLPFNLGRLGSYTFAGAIAGAAGAGWSGAFDGTIVRQSLFVAANTMLILLGISLATGWSLSHALERAGGKAWALARPAAAGLLGSSSPGSGFALGTLWGAMPCALVYAMLLSALVSGSAANGALTLLAFGLGTLPNLLAISLAWAWPAAFGGIHTFAPERRGQLKFWLGVAIAAFGVFGFLRLPAIVKLHGFTALCHPGFS